MLLIIQLKYKEPKFKICYWKFKIVKKIRVFHNFKLPVTDFKFCLINMFCFLVKTVCYLKLNVYECHCVALCKVIRDSLGFQLPWCRFQIRGTRFKIPLHWIPDSKKSVLQECGFLDLDFVFQRVGYHMQIFLWIRESGLSYMGRHCVCNGRSN